jgi:hypothetical protein
MTYCHCSASGVITLIMGLGIRIGVQNKLLPDIYP